MLTTKQLSLLLLASLVFSPTAFTQQTQLDCSTQQRVSYFNINTATQIEPVFCQGKVFSNGLAAVSNGEKWGYIDSTGKLIIDFQYTNADSFHNGYAAVEKEGKWGVIDKANQPTANLQFDGLTTLVIDENIYFIASHSDANNLTKYGIITPNGDTLINFDYVDITYLADSRQIHAGFIDDAELKRYSNSFFKPKKSLQEAMGIQVYNKKLQPVERFDKQTDQLQILRAYPNWVDEQGNFSEDFYANKVPETFSHEKIAKQIIELNSQTFDEANKVGVKSAQSVIIEPQFDKVLAGHLIFTPNATDNSDSDLLIREFNGEHVSASSSLPSYILYFYKVVKQGKIGIYSLTGNPIIAPQYDNIEGQDNGFVVTQTNSGITTKALINPLGQEIIAAGEYDAIYNTEGQRIIVSQSYEQISDYKAHSVALFTDKGELLVPFNLYNDIAWVYSSENLLETTGYAIVKKYHGDDLKYGVIDNKGKEIITPDKAYIIGFLANETVIVIQKSFSPVIYQLYYPQTGTYSADIDAANWDQTIWSEEIGELADGMLMIRLN